MGVIISGQGVVARKARAASTTGAGASSGGCGARAPMTAQSALRSFALSAVDWPPRFSFSFHSRSRPVHQPARVAVSCVALMATADAG